MQWLPDTIDAMTRLCHEVGAVAFIVFLVLAGLMLILWRHMGQIIPLVKTYVENDRRASARIIDELSHIKQTNSQIVERVSKIPSDPPVCNAKTREEIAEIIQIEFAKHSGEKLSISEAALIAKHRDDVQKQAVKTMEMPKAP